MNEEKNLNNVTTEVNNTSPVEPVQPVETPVPETSASVEPVQSTENSTTVDITPNNKKLNPIVVIILILILIGLCGYRLYQYTDIFKGKVKKTDNEVTTTTTVLSNNADGEFPITSFEDYVAIVKKNTKDINSDDDQMPELIDLDNKTYYIDYDFDNKCKNDGDKISFTVGSANIEYTCKKMINDEIVDEEVLYWNIDITINDSLKSSKIGWSTCEGSIHYTDGKNLLEIITSCGTGGGTSFTLSKMNNTSLKIKKYEGNLVSKDGRNYDKTPILIKDNTLYFIEADEVKEDNPTTCRIKSVDLNSDSYTKNDLGLTTDCFYTFGNS